MRERLSSTPDAGAFWRVIAEHGCVAMQAASTEFHSIKKEDPEGKYLHRYDLSKFRALFLVGERAYPDTVMWAERLLKVPVIDHWWQTETGWPIAGNPLGLGILPVKPGLAGGRNAGVSGRHRRRGGQAATA